MTIKAMKAIQMVYANTTKHDWPDDIWEAICQAIAEAEKHEVSQEPVAWMKEQWSPDCGPYIEIYSDDEMGFRDRKEWTPLYTTPQPKREWVGLTDDEIEQGCKESWVTLQAWQSAVWWAEERLKEKNT
jgi:hypothetical protein